MNFSSLSPYVHWLEAQFSAIVHTVTAVASNEPQPARTTVIYTVVVAVVALWLIFKIVRKARK